MNIGVIIASNRPNRNGIQVAEWVKKHTNQDKEANYTYLDLAEIDLPFLNEPDLPSAGNYKQDHTKKWSKKVAAQDGFLIITPEYNHGYPASLKNALDTLYDEWLKKPVAFVGYGVLGAARSIEHIAGTVLQLQMIPFTSVANSVNILFFRQLDENGKFVPTPRNEKTLINTLNNLKKWTAVIKDNRDKL